MKNDKNFEMLKKELMDVEVPHELYKRMEEAKNRAEKDKNKMINGKKRKNNGLKYGSIAAVAVVAVFIGSVNVSPAFANSLKDVPILGSIVKVITIDKITDQNEYLDAKINVAGIEGNDEANKVLRAEADKAYQAAKDKAAFVEAAVKKTGEKVYIPANVMQDYEVISCINGILSVKISTLEVQASGYETVKGINIDLVSNKVIELKDLFHEDADYVSIISKDILKQMKEQMAKDESKSYFIEKEDMTDQFQQIKPDQTYFIDKKGNLIIAFDEYEVAPGYMGAVSFTIDSDAIKNIRK